MFNPIEPLGGDLREQAPSFLEQDSEILTSGLKKSRFRLLLTNFAGESHWTTQRALLLAPIVKSKNGLTIQNLNNMEFLDLRIEIARNKDRNTRLIVVRQIAYIHFDYFIHLVKNFERSSIEKMCFLAIKRSTPFYIYCSFLL